MAKSLDDVLGSLDKVFAGDVEYDECLMELGLHTAQVRKQWPALYHALLTAAPNSDEGSVLSEAQIGWIRKALDVRPGDALPIKVRASETHSPLQVDRPIDVPAMPYLLWAALDGPAHTTDVNKDWEIEWNVTTPDGGEVPMPAGGTTITLRGASRRTRFQVLESNPETRVMKVRAIALLPIR